MEINNENTQGANVETNAAQNTSAQATETSGAQQQAPAAQGQQQSYDTLLGGKAGEGTNNGTDVPGAQQAAQQVEYNFTDTVKAYEQQFDFSEQDKTNFVNAINGMNLSNEQANAMLKYGMDWGKQIVEQAQQNVQAELDEMVKGWGETTKRELGPDFDATMSKAGSALETVEKTVPGIRQALQETGAGNRVEIIKALAFFADKIAGDPGMVAGAQGSKPADNFAALYPNTDWSKI